MVETVERNLPWNGVPDLSKMSPEEFDAELEKGWQAMLAGDTIPAKQAFDELRKKYML